MPPNGRSDIIFDEDEDLDGGSERLLPTVGSGAGQGLMEPLTSGSHYRLSKPEVVRGFANRIVHSRAYIVLYLGMAVLSLTTVVLSLLGDCPPTSFYVLEVIVNTAMIVEVAIRIVAYGNSFFTTWVNLLDLGVTTFCIVTLIVVFSRPCSRGEEVLDSVVLVIRNLLQFGRLATLLRSTGTSIFSRPPPIDLSQAREAALQMDLDLEDDEAVAAHHLSAHSTLQSTGGRGYDRVRDEPEEEEEPPRRGVGPVGGDRGRENLSAEDEDQWDRMV